MRVGYNHFISNKAEWNCFSKFSKQVLLPIFISTILQNGKFLNLVHYFPYDVKLQLMAHSRSFLASQKARNAIVGAENLLIEYIPKRLHVVIRKASSQFDRRMFQSRVHLIETKGRFDRRVNDNKNYSFASV